MHNGPNEKLMTVMCTCPITVMISVCINRVIAIGTSHGRDYVFTKNSAYQTSSSVVQNSPTMIRPILLRVIPTLISCSSVKKPRFSSNHPLSGCTCSGFAISDRGWERTVESSTMSYSSPSKEKSMM